MGRIIKFRAWDTKKNKMYSAEELGQDQLTLSVDGRGFINVHGKSTKLSKFYTHLIPEQFTGIEDKNGKEIYEGDIVRHLITSTPKNMYETKQIIWDISSMKLQGKNKRASFLEWPATYCLEVIGNIHENPELLK